MSDLYKKVVDGWPVIAAAPETFAAIMVAFIIVAVTSIWVVLSWSYRTRLESFQARLGSRDDQIASLQRQRDEYKEKLSGASPDEAKARIDELERRLFRLEPRKLTAEQHETITKVLKSSHTAAINAVEVAHDMACPDCNGYAAEFSNAIKGVTSWMVSEPAVMGPSVKSPKGVAILVPDLNNPNPTATTLMRAFTEAGIAFDALRAPVVHTPPMARVLVTARVV